MKPQDALQELKALIPPGTPLKEALSKFIEHYRSTEIEGCSKANDGDMLLFQWGGPYSWDPHFSINLTRQFTHNDEDGEYEGMEQLQMDCKFVADESWPESGNRWLEGPNISEFMKEVLASNAVLAAGEKNMISIDWDLNDV